MDRGSARRNAATYTQGNTDTEKTHTDIHASSGFRTHDPIVWALDRAATVIGQITNCIRKKCYKSNEVIQISY
jgi:hypothetical protein